MTPSVAELVGDPARVVDVDPAELPVVLAKLTTLAAAVAARITASSSSTGPAAAPAEERLLRADEAAAMLSVSTDFLYRSEAARPFRVKLGGEVRFSLLGILKYVDRHRG